MSGDPATKNSSRIAGSRSRLPQPVIDDVLAGADLISLIRESTPVRETFGQVMAHCPFHKASHDGKPSMVVDRDDQRFTCSVCGFGGSAIGWLMYHDGLSFPEAVLALASRASVDVSPWITSAETEASLQHRLDMLATCADLYAEELASPAGDEARAYLASRGISDETAERYQLGFAGGGMETLEAAFPQRSRDLWRNGVVSRYADKRFTPRFNERLIFPICSSRGDVVAFGARALDDRRPTYLNSSTSPVFNKRETLYGWPQAIEATESRDCVFLIEGYFDVISLSQAGIRNVVGTLGTACSEAQLRALGAHTRRIVCCFDGDDAGQAAALHCLHTALPHLGEFDRLALMYLPNGHDPDSFVRAHGADAFLAHAQEAIGAEEVLFQSLIEDVDTSSIGDLARLGVEANALVSRIGNADLRARVVSRLDQVIGVPWHDCGG